MTKVLAFDHKQGYVFIFVTHFGCIFDAFLPLFFFVLIRILDIVQIGADQIRCQLHDSILTALRHAANASMAVVEHERSIYFDQVSE